MCGISIFFCIMTMISNFMLFSIFQIFIFKFFFKSILIFEFSYDSCCSFVNDFIFFFLKLIVFIECFLNNSQNFFMKSLLLYVSCLFSMLLKSYIVDIEKPDGICSLSFDVDEFSGLFLHPSIFSIMHSSDCNWSRTHNHLLSKRILNHLAKLTKNCFK